MKPVIALVGRPNVGKSTLFNRLTKSRDAIVADFAGLTRDRHYGNGKQGKHEYIVIDTGGFEPDASSGIYREMAKQTQQAVAEADVVIFVVDARAGVSAQDHDIANYLRRLGKPCILVANKAEGMLQGIQLAEFYELGLGDVYPVSAAHGQGIRGLVDLALEPLHLPDPDDTEESVDKGVIKLAVAGRPNVGKSTLINTWLGEERLVAFDMPGTTRDAITVPFERNGQRFELVDTAGLRRKGKVFEAIEKFSVVKTLQAIESANVVLLLLDATQGVTDQDAHIAGYILESGRAVVVAVNKWDAVDDREAARREDPGRTEGDDDGDADRKRRDGRDGRRFGGAQAGGEPLHPEPEERVAERRDKGERGARPVDRQPPGRSAPEQEDAPRNRDERRDGPSSRQGLPLEERPKDPRDDRRGPDGDHRPDRDAREPDGREEGELVAHDARHGDEQRNERRPAEGGHDAVPLHEHVPRQENAREDDAHGPHGKRMRPFGSEGLKDAAHPPAHARHHDEKHSPDPIRVPVHRQSPPFCIRLMDYRQRGRFCHGGCYPAGQSMLRTRTLTPLSRSRSAIFRTSVCS